MGTRAARVFVCSRSSSSQSGPDAADAAGARSRARHLGLRLARAGERRAVVAPGGGARLGQRQRPLRECRRSRRVGESGGRRAPPCEGCGRGRRSGLVIGRGVVSWGTRGRVVNRLSGEGSGRVLVWSSCGGFGSGGSPRELLSTHQYCFSREKTSRSASVTCVGAYKTSGNVFSLLILAAHVATPGAWGSGIGQKR